MTDIDRAKVEARYQWALGVVGHRNGVLLHPEDAVIVAELMRQDALLAPPPSSAAERKCEKCGSTDIALRHVQGMASSYLDARCRTCGNTWFSKPNDEASEGRGPDKSAGGDTAPIAATAPVPPAASRPIETEKLGRWVAKVRGRNVWSRDHYSQRENAEADADNRRRKTGEDWVVVRLTPAIPKPPVSAEQLRWIAGLLNGRDYPDSGDIIATLADWIAALPTDGEP